MGYTHNWTTKRPFTQKAWRAICRDVSLLIEKSPVPLMGPEAGGKPEVSAGRIAFNGIGGDAHEDFWFLNDRDNPFCKTARKPYDLLVCAALIVINHHAGGNVEITSDGGMASFREDYSGPHDSEWNDALAFVRTHLGSDYKLPPLIQYRSMKDARVAAAQAA